MNFEAQTNDGTDASADADRVRWLHDELAALRYYWRERQQRLVKPSLGDRTATVVTRKFASVFSGQCGTVGNTTCSK